jgi:hypothetical protein
MYLGVAVSIAVLVFAPGLGWKDIRKVKDLQAITQDSPDRSEKKKVDETGGKSEEAVDE